MHRFYVPSLDPGDELATLPRSEADHLMRVLRLGAGDTVSVFDGRGHEFLARVGEASRNRVQVQILSRVTPPPEPAVHVTLVQAVLKGDKMDDVVRDSVMLGVSAIQPLVTRRTEVTVAALLRGGRTERWRRVALASAKQSRRAVVPEIRTPLSLDSYLDEPSPAASLMFIEPEAGAGGETLAALRAEPIPQEAAVWVGPEGGWDEREWRTAHARGARLMSLGHRTLRADAVAIAALSVLYFLWE